MIAHDCVSSTLTPYVPSTGNPWDDRKIRHLFNRLGYGATLNELQMARSMSPSDLVDFLLDTAAGEALPTKDDYPWADAVDYDEDNPSDNYQRFLQASSVWFKKAIESPVKNKLVMFWHNHFVTEAREYGRHSTWMFQYWYVLHKNALGNFKTFIKDIGRTPAMLRYLNGDRNRRQFPNENYGRELVELFTLGEGNYTQNDIEEISRALTGWKTQTFNRDKQKTEVLPNNFGEFIFVANDHDYGEKTIFGETYSSPMDDGSFDYNKVHDLIFDKKGDVAAKFICRKLYANFVYAEVDNQIVNELAETLKNNNWELLPVLKQLFKSEHFFDEKFQGCQIKSSLDIFLNYYHAAGLEYAVDYFYYDYSKPDNPYEGNNPNNINTLFLVWRDGGRLGQSLYDPVNVAGWPGYRTWINEFILVNRWNYLRDHLVNRLKYEVTHEKYRELMKQLSNNSTNPRVVTEKLVEHFMAVELDEQALDNAEVAFKEIVPENYFEDGSWNLDFDEAPMQFVCLLTHLITVPEFQLI